MTHVLYTAPLMVPLRLVCMRGTVRRLGNDEFFWVKGTFDVSGWHGHMHSDEYDDFTASFTIRQVAMT